MPLFLISGLLVTQLCATPLDIRFLRQSPQRGKTYLEMIQTKKITVKEKNGRTARITADKEGHFRFPTQAGKTHQITS